MPDDNAEEKDEAPTRQLRQRSTPVDYYPQGQEDEDEQEDVAASDEDSVIEDSASSDGDDASPSPSPFKKQRLNGDVKGKGSNATKSQPSKRKSNGKPIVPPNWAACPVCNNSFPMAIFNDHLDK